MNQFTLNDGRRLPALGLGTWQASETGEAYEAVKHALKVGYRHIDCAWVYGNEREVGEAIKDVIAEGVVKRQDLWITSKLWNHRHEHDLVEEACRTSLTALNLDYLDLYLVHWPMAFNRDTPFPKSGSDYQTLTAVPLHKTWEAMESLKYKGLAKSIGVSNFSCHHLQQLLRQARVPPAVNQVELHPYLTQEKLMAFALENNIILTAYSPLGSGKKGSTIEESKQRDLLESLAIKTIALKYGVTASTVLISWAIQRGTAVIPKSTNKGRIAANFKAASLILDKDDMVKLEGLNRNQRNINPTIWFGDDSPYSQDSLWCDDGQ